MKSGTTWVDDYLRWRGDVLLPKDVKETFFFDKFYDRGTDWYANHFRESPNLNSRLAVEVAPSLFHYLDAPDRINKTIGAVPLITIKRDPVDRAWSHYLHLRRKGYTKSPIQAAIRDFPEIIAASCHRQMTQYWKLKLTTSKIAELNFDTLKTDRRRFARELCHALDLNFINPPNSFGSSNATGVPPSFVLAKAGRIAAASARSFGGYRIVNAAKAMGLKKVFFGTDGGRKTLPSENDISVIEEEIARQEKKTIGSISPL